MSPTDKPVVWFRGEIQSPPFSAAAKREAGYLIGQLQHGAMLELPQSRPMPSIGRGCHELRIQDENKIWRIVYLIESDAIVVLEVFSKKTQTTPKSVINTCKDRLKRYKHESR